jgi:vancomycin resistance protein VanW
MRRRLFCEISPLCYAISLRKEILFRHVKNTFGRDRLTKAKQEEPLPNTVKAHASILVRRLHGVDPVLQENKVTNIDLACRKIHGALIRPGETFSFWHYLGKATKRKGYREGLVIHRHTFGRGIGGGLCQMANMIHWLVLNSPLTVTELHHHSDALFPDERRSVPFGTGTSVVYNALDYRFRNDTDQTVQILVWCENGSLCGELRSERPFPHRYHLIEEDHHFRREGEDYFRVSQVYRLVYDRETKECIAKDLILNNHSKVMYDHALIPADQIRLSDD